ncbi:MAG: hypothetical protein ABIP94_02695, partial [Planctomycetota bacterium]
EFDARAAGQRECGEREQSQNGAHEGACADGEQGTERKESKKVRRESESLDRSQLWRRATFDTMECTANPGQWI